MSHDPGRSTAPFSEESARRTALVVWGAILATMASIVAGSCLVASGVPMPLTPERASFLGAFPLIGGAELLASAALFTAIRLRRPPPAAASAEGAARGRFMRFFAAMVICSAIHESITVLGFVQCLITKNAADVAPYAIASIAASLAVFPSRARIARF